MLDTVRQRRTNKALTVKFAFAKNMPRKWAITLQRFTPTKQKVRGAMVTSVYYSWFGWSDDSMARQVYTHKTDYEKQQSQEWAKKFE